MEAIAEKLLKEEEEAKLAQAAEAEDDMTPLDQTGTQMQDAFRKMLEKKMLEQFAKEKQQKELILSDEVKVKAFPWSYLKWEAMEDKFDLTHPDYDFSSSDQEMLKQLIEAQKKQGDMLELKPVKGELIV